MPRDIADAFVSADWQAAHKDFIEANFTGMSGHFQPDPDGFTLGSPTSFAYREEWSCQAAEFVAKKAGALPATRATVIFHATRLEVIEIDGDRRAGAQEVRRRADRQGRRQLDRMNWQTLYICRRDGAPRRSRPHGYLPYIKE